jgi:general stress protein 26
MVTDKNLSFLTTKMQELGCALFYNFSTSVLKFPVCIINFIKVDEVGQVWFSVTKPAQCLTNFDPEFGGMLHFYKKNVSYHLKVHGKAVIVNDPEELYNLDDELKTFAANKEVVLLKFKIAKAEYFDNQEKETAGIIAGIKNYISKWIFREEPGYHPYFLNGDSAAA